MTVDRERLGAALPAYDIGDELGQGGWGVVVAAWHRQLERPVAVKQLPPSLSADPSVRARFLVEARVLARLDHPHIVPVYDFVDADGLCLLVMEQLPGGSLWSRFAEAGLSMESSCAVVMAACSGLHCAHRLGVLHRDVKPENLLFSANGALKITDFGIAKVVGGEETMATRAGQVLGTPAYMSPEQATGAELDPSTDVYATGTMLYELLSGRLPFPSEGTPMSTLFQRVFEAPTPLAEVAPHVPDAIADVVMRALATRADERYASAEDLGVALAEATAAVWGPGWVESCGDLVVTGSPRIETASRRPSSPGGQEARSAGAPWPGTEELPCVRPAPSGRVLHSTVLDPVAEELVPIQQVVAARTRAWPQLLVALVLLLATAGLAFLTRGSPALTGSIPPSSLTVAGAHPTPGRSLELDTAQPLALEATLPPTASAADSAQLSFSAVGVPLGAITAPLEAADGGRVRATIELGERRYLVPSGATARVSLLHGGSAVADASFPVRTTQSSWLTAPGVAAPLLLLFSLAYVESLLRSLRRGQRRLSAMPGLAVIGLALGVSLSLLAWIATGRPPTVAGLILCALGGSGFALAAGAAAIRLARRRLLGR